MGAMLKTLLRTLILDDAAYREWRERPNLFLRGIVLVLVISLVAGLVTFGINLVAQVRPVDAGEIEREIRESLDMQRRFNPSMQDPEVQEMIEGMMDVMVPMIVDVAGIPARLPAPVSGFFGALGSWLSAGLAAIGGWLFYGALVLIGVNLLGGTARLGEFYGTVAVYAIPGMLGLLGPIPCVGWLIALVGTIWGIVMYVKATSVVSGLDIGRSVVAVLAPAVAILVLAILLAMLFVLWLVILF